MDEEFRNYLGLEDSEELYFKTNSVGIISYLAAPLIFMMVFVIIFLMLNIMRIDSIEKNSFLLILILILIIILIVGVGYVCDGMAAEILGFLVITNHRIGRIHGKALLHRKVKREWIEIDNLSFIKTNELHIFFVERKNDKEFHYLSSNSGEHQNLSKEKYIQFGMSGMYGDIIKKEISNLLIEKFSFSQHDKFKHIFFNNP